MVHLFLRILEISTWLPKSKAKQNKKYKSQKYPRNYFIILEKKNIIKTILCGCFINWLLYRITNKKYHEIMKVNLITRSILLQFDISYFNPILGVSLLKLSHDQYQIVTETKPFVTYKQTCYKQ